jgi:hypothetical protein
MHSIAERMELAVMARARLLPCPARDVGLVVLSFSVPARTHMNIAIVMDGSASPEIDKDLEKGPDGKPETVLSFFLEVLMH